MLLPGLEVVGLRSALSEACELAPNQQLAAEKLDRNTNGPLDAPVFRSANFG